MKLLHCFVTHDGCQRRWLASADYCIYCKQDTEYLYQKILTKEQKELLMNSLNVNTYIISIDRFKDYCDFYNKYTSCPNGITEEEYMIKDILE